MTIACVAGLAAYHHVTDRAVLPRSDSPQTTITKPAPPRTPRYADFAGETPSADARSIADWVVDSGDNQRMPFVIVDKIDAKVFVFDAAGRLRGASAALLGSARGDDSAPGVGEKKISEITPEERTTPAGRFIAERGVNLAGDDILWVDYDAAVSLHPVRTGNPKERRLKRLASPTPEDNRISYGCINVPAQFYRDIVAPTFKGTYGVAYVLPETRPARAVFRSYDVPRRAARAGLVEPG